MALFHFRLAATIGAAITCGSVSGGPAAAQPVAAAGYTVKVFATPPAGISAPDSIAISGTTIWVSYGNGAPPDGSSGSSTVIAYSLSGATLHTLTIAGHSDGLRLNRATGFLWSLQNEDASPNLVLIEAKTGRRSAPIPLSSVDGGGFDDVAFIDGRMFISASNPTLDSKGVNTNPALIEARRTAAGIDYSTVLLGNASAVNVVTRKPATLNLTDPDSLVPTPSGDLLLDDQGDGQLIVVNVTTETGPRVRQIPLLSGVQVDDTVFATAQSGTLLVADRDANTVYALTSKHFTVDQPYSASTGVGTTVPAFVGELFLDSGALVPILTGLVSPHGLAFLANAGG